MNMKKKLRFWTAKRKKGKRDETGTTLVDGTLRVSCRACGNHPDYGSQACLECLKSAIIAIGEPERIILEKGVETEYSGDAVRIINALAAIESSNWDVSLGGDGPGCAKCGYSMGALREIVWESFPDIDIGGCIGHLDGFMPEKEECRICVNRAYKALARAESSFGAVSDDILRAAYKTVGV
ncbi:MAG: hypothetical protein GX224_04270 [Thermoplasmatales archaeon]|nr:hypothetical protein [Thermoplasmatales archaeon]